MEIVKQFNPLSIYNNYNETTNSYKYEINIEFGQIYFKPPIIHFNHLFNR
jgi:hypothetical protein